MKSKKLTDLVKSVPSTIQGSVKFPTNVEQKEKITYNVADLGQLQAGENPNCTISAKLVSHMPKE